MEGHQTYYVGDPPVKPEEVATVPADVEAIADHSAKN